MSRYDLADLAAKAPPKPPGWEALEHQPAPRQPDWRGLTAAQQRVLAAWVAAHGRQTPSKKGLEAWIDHACKALQLAEGNEVLADEQLVCGLVDAIFDRAAYLAARDAWRATEAAHQDLEWRLHYAESVLDAATDLAGQREEDDDDDDEGDDALT